MNLADATLFVLALAVLGLGVSVIWGGIRLELLRARVVELTKELDRRTNVIPLFAIAQSCRVCQATDDAVILAGCWWVSPDLCSSCDDDAASSLARGERA
ncbi:hypothetical protein [Microbacterium dauci]|uniref:Uncharacterized protein n=1 Tax=Microbacterium dauci TaxID=3048008 RepID=A0ABT6ZAN0_9MICO|nr:hypothetical protein [Microbacterium sp. LX3-4]MDJ1113209.1 hypothetical protein [Microbacterium sp. LX3-4]